MFRHLIDRIIEFPPNVVILALVHAAALFWALRHKDKRPVFALNVVMGAVILAYNARMISGAYGYDDWLFLLIGIAAISLICSSAALASVRVPRPVIWIVWTTFGLNCAFSLLLVAMTFFIKFDKMI